MSLIQIWDEQGNLINIDDYGLFGLRLNIPSPSYAVTKESIPGRKGAVTLGRDLLPRPMTAEFKITSEDYDGSLVVRDEVYSLFSKGNTFYIGEEKQPNKRWLVECTEEWTPERINTHTFTTVIPLLADSGCAESVKNTLDPTLFSAQLSGTKLIKYKHNTTTFEIFNDGEKIDPRYMPLVITFKGASSNLKIKNLSTNEEWSYTNTTTNSDEIKLDGVRSTKNGLSILRDTNKKLLSLAPGWNEFQLTGTSGSFEISFDFRFHTL